MESHQPDPKAPGSDDHWETVAAELRELGGRFTESYRRMAEEGGPSEEEIRQALATLGGAWDRVAGSVSSALQEEEVRRRLRQAAAALAAALGATLSQLGEDLEEPADGPGAEEE